MSEPKQPPVPITPSAPAPSPAMTPDEFAKMVRADPRARLIEPSGMGFILPCKTDRGPFMR